jgi:ribosomal protein L11 methylase PrmA
MDVVGRMLRLGKVTSGDVVYDLGCGDGRIVIEAARIFGARGVGIDIDPALIARAQANARQAGVESLVTFRVQDAMTVDVSDATVVTLYLLAASNVKLRPILTRTLRPGARIVAHNYPIGDWEPDVVDTFTDTAGTTRTLFLWTIK